MPSQFWRFKNTFYITGDTIGSRLDVAALGLEPLKLFDRGEFDPHDEDLLEDNDPFSEYYATVMARGVRQKYEMEQVLPFFDVENLDGDPILAAVEERENGNFSGARQILGKLFREDLRCIDAHAHLGNWEFDAFSTWGDSHKMALRHYEAGVRIAELTLGENFNGLLPWGFIDNRPYLRCLHGLGLCLWIEKEYSKAKDIFQKMLLLNPWDNQGMRFLLPEIDAGREWSDHKDDE